MPASPIESATCLKISGRFKEAFALEELRNERQAQRKNYSHRQPAKR
jgi:hypothetical protein